MLKILPLVMTACLMTTTALAQPRYTLGNEPVTLSASETDPCSFGVIADQGPEGAVGVFPGPSMELDITEYVAGGTPVWVCEASIDGDMLGIIYANFPDTDCELSSPVEQDVDYFGPCESGWVESDTVELQAG